MPKTKPQVTILDRDLNGNPIKAAQPTRLGRWAIPSVFVAQVFQPSDPMVLIIEVRTRAGRPPEITDLRITWHDLRRPAGITPAGLRQIRLGEALKLALEAAREPLEEASDGLFRTADTEPGVFYAGPEPQPGRGKVVSDAHLRRVAKRYRELVSSGSRSPTQDMADEFHWSRSTVGRWLVEARRRGILGPAVGTKAGIGKKGAK